MDTLVFDYIRVYAYRGNGLYLLCVRQNLAVLRFTLAG